MSRIEPGEGFRPSEGYAIFAGAIPTGIVESLKQDIAAVVRDEPVRPFGVRSLAIRCRKVAELAQSDECRDLVDGILGTRHRLVRSIFFDKLPGANWHVGWHQDLSIAVRERPDLPLPGFTGWTEKEGILHVQAPPAVLDQMITLRVHLDAAPSTNGPLRVIPGSHREGRLDSAVIEAWIDRGTAVTCEVEAGDVIAMRPQLLHASHRASEQGLGHRRVVHLEFAAEGILPDGLDWAN